jgi:hypothetical protein
MPWVLVAALVVGVGFAVFSSTPSPERIAPAPVASTDPGSRPDDEPPSPGMPAEPPQETLTGVIREHIDVAQYTYLRLATDAGETWAAVYRAPVKDGATVSVEHASELRGFHSTELKRDFAEIWFGMLPGYDRAPAPNAVSPAPAAAAPAGGKMAAGTMTIASLAKGAASLDGKEATISGHVVKENDGIMGRNWIHLQDGSGSASDGTNDILVTTDGTAKVGDTLVATGTVRTNQDFGSGYAYKFMLETATVRPASPP